MHSDLLAPYGLGVLGTNSCLTPVILQTQPRQARYFHHRGCACHAGLHSTPPAKGTRWSQVIDAHQLSDRAKTPERNRTCLTYIQVPACCNQGRSETSRKRMPAVQRADKATQTHPGVLIVSKRRRTVQKCLSHKV